VGVWEAELQGPGQIPSGQEREAAAAVAAPQRMMMTRSHSDQMREAGKGH